MERERLSRAKKEDLLAKSQRLTQRLKESTAAREWYRNAVRVFSGCAAHASRSAANEPESTWLVTNSVFCQEWVSNHWIPCAEIMREHCTSTWIRDLEPRLHVGQGAEDWFERNEHRVVAFELGREILVRFLEGEALPSIVAALAETRLGLGDFRDQIGWIFSEIGADIRGEAEAAFGGDLWRDDEHHSSRQPSEVADDAFREVRTDEQTIQSRMHGERARRVTEVWEALKGLEREWIGSAKLNELGLPSGTVYAAATQWGEDRRGGHGGRVEYRVSRVIKYVVEAWSPKAG